MSAAPGIALRLGRTAARAARVPARSFATSSAAPRAAIAPATRAGASTAAWRSAVASSSALARGMPQCASLKRPLYRFAR